METRESTRTSLRPSTYIFFLIWKRENARKLYDKVRSRRVRLHIPKRSTVKVAEAESKERRKAEGGERLFLHCRFPCSVETRGYAGWSHANARHVHTGFTRIFINCAPA